MNSNIFSTLAFMSAGAGFVGRCEALEMSREQTRICALRAATGIISADTNDSLVSEEIVLADPNADLVNQLARIADALSKPSSSPWIEWAKTLASFVAGMALTYFSIALQGRVGDKREQRKMRRIIYTELTNSFLYLFEFASGLRGRKKSPRTPNSAGEIHPPMADLLNLPFTFEGEDYIRQHHSVAYELSEMPALKRMYGDLSRLSPGTTVTLGELEAPLVRFGLAFKSDAVIRNNFRKFAGTDLGAIEAVANHFADHKVKAEDLMVLKEMKTGGDSE
jgi:hypothetical protein